MDGTEHFDLAATMDAITQGIVSIVCRIGFEAAVHGLVLAGVVLAASLFYATRKHRFAKPLVTVAKKLSIFCAIIAIPGVISLVSTGKLPPINSLQLSSVGLIGFWTLVTLHLCMEEINFQLIQSRGSQKG